MFARGKSVEDRNVLTRLVLLLLACGVSGVLLAALALPVVGAVGLVSKETADGFDALPASLTTPPLPQRSRILDADGKRIATFYTENRVSVPLKNISTNLQNAVVAIEDSRFWEHGGIDLRGTTRALVNNSTGESVQGGSTITQQYVKQVLLESAIQAGDKEAAEAATVRGGTEGYARKLREVRFAVALEKEKSKEQILEGYLNIAYFGSGTYGAEAASVHYFSKSASKLSIEQAATLAGIVRNPQDYDPTRNPEAAQDRRNTVLQRMRELNYITSDAQLAKLQAIDIKRLLKVSPLPNGCSTSRVPYFCDFVTWSIRNDPAYGKTPEERERLLKQGGLTITTTLDPQIQKAAQDAVDENVPRDDKSGIAAAITMVKPGDGAILAMAQNRSWGENDKRGSTYINFNVDKAYGGSAFGFQPGSTFKAFTAAAALKQGLPISTKVPAPAEGNYEDFVDCETKQPYPGLPYKPKNSTRSARGDVDMATGLAYSLNTWAVSLEERTGLCAPAEMAESLGMHRGDGEKIQRGPSQTLGTTEVAPLSLTEAYASFAARGKWCNSYAIAKITDRAGKALPVTKPQCKQQMTEKVADGVNYLLSGVIDGPLPGRTGARMSLGRDAAGKTGTTQDNKDVWFAGYTPNMAAAVWVGDPGRPDKNGRTVRKAMQNITINGKFVRSGYGGDIAGPIWKQAMLAAVDDLPREQFEAPDTTVQYGERVEVPNVRRLSEQDALAELRAAGFEGRVADYDVPSAGTDRGDVVFTSPRIGNRITTGSTVTIYLSNGRAPVAENDDDDGTGGGGDTPVTPAAPPPANGDAPAAAGPGG